MRSRYWVHLLVAVLLGCSAPAQNEPPASVPEPAPLAVIHEITGTVTVSKAGDPEPTPAEEDMPLGAGDRVTTGADGSVTISLRDESFVKLDALANLTIKELRSDQVAGGIWARLALATGKLMAVVANLASADSRFEVETPTAVAAVKGTAFQVAASGKSTTISVLEGSVATSGVRDATASPEQVEVKEGFETEISAKTRRPGRLTKFFGNEKRKKARVALSEFRAKSHKWRLKGQSGELHRNRRLRTLSRALLIERFMQKNPGAFQALPEWKRARMEQFLAGHKPELDASREEISRFLKSNPNSRKHLEDQAGRRFARPRGATNRRTGKTGQPSPSGRPRPARQAR